MYQKIMQYAYLILWNITRGPSTKSLLSLSRDNKFLFNFGWTIFIIIQNLLGCSNGNLRGNQSIVKVRKFYAPTSKKKIIIQCKTPFNSWGSLSAYKECPNQFFGCLYYSFDFFSNFPYGYISSLRERCVISK